MNTSNTSTVKLSLANFKSHQSLELEFPKTGFFKLDGISGAGKTNIFKSIVWALWGSGNDVIKRGEKKCQVSLEGLLPISICRDKPNRLSVNGSSDGEMQAKIAETLGMTETEFEISSYLQSEYQNALVYRTPAEQLELFANLAGSKNQPDLLKEKTELKIDVCRKELASYEQIISKNEVLITAHQTKIKEFENQYQETTEPESLNLDIQLAKRTIASLTEQASLLTKDLQDPVRAACDRAIVAKESQERNILRLQTEIDSFIEPSPGILDGLAEEVDSLKAEMDSINKQIIYQEKLIAQSANKKMLLEKTTSANNQFKASLRGYLETEDTESLSSISDQALNLSSYNKSLGMISGSTDQLEADREIDDSRKTVEIIKQKIRTKKEEIDLIVHKKSKVTILNSEREIAKNTLEKAIKIINANLQMASVEHIQASLTQLRAEIEQTNGLIQKYELNQAEWRNYRRTVESNEKIKEIITNTGYKLNSLEVEISISQDEIQKLIYTISELTKFESLINRASLDALDQVIQDVNDRAAIFLEQFFGGAFTAKFVTSRETKSKKKVDKIQLDITENGEAIAKLSSCSTGQQTKIALAFALAISSTFQSPILLLDESLRGLDSESMENCVQAIKDVASERLVLVNEHTAFAGFFDGIYSI
jgi:DNA repair exonuclease SbcCD ATPase subunit